jgi:hypothetical protein
MGAEMLAGQQFVEHSGSPDIRQTNALSPM